VRGRVLPPLPLLAIGAVLSSIAWAPPASTRATVGPVPAQVRTPAGAGAAQPFLARGPRGELALSWLEPRPRGGHRLRVARYDGTRFTRASTIAEGDSFFVNWADFPSVVFLGDGTLAAHWLWKVGAGTYAYQVRLAFSKDDGRTWGAPIVPHRDGTATEHGFVSLLAEGTEVRAVWLDGRNTPGAMTVRTAVIGADGRIHAERELDERACDCCQTALARTGRGLVAAYRDRSEEEVRDIALVRLTDAWSAPRVEMRDGWRITGCPVNGPALDALGDRVVLAWFTAARDTPKVMAATSLDGGRTFGPARRIDDGKPLGRVDVAVLEGGGAIVSWLERDGDRADLRHRRLPLEGPVPASRSVADLAGTRASGVPQVVVSAGEAFVAGTDATKGSRLRVLKYDAAAWLPGSRR
jgi:hypothetical protein